MARLVAPGGTLAIGEVSDLAKKAEAMEIRAQSHKNQPKLSTADDLDHLLPAEVAVRASRRGPRLARQNRRSHHAQPAVVSSGALSLHCLLPGTITMKAIILAAGYGNRMKPLTDATHKTLLSVGGNTIIGRICDGLAANGVLDVAIVTGYRNDELQSYMRANYPHLHLEFVHNARYRETNNIYSMALAFEQMTIDDDIILIESDLDLRAGRPRSADSSRRGRTSRWSTATGSGMDGTVVTLTRTASSRNVIPPHLQSASFDFSDKYKTLNIYQFSQGVLRRPPSSSC